MYYTLAQAEEKLARFADGGACDVRSAINDAIEQLSSLELWRCMKRIVRIAVKNDVLPLPQNVEALLRVCVDGRPSHVFGTDYQFLQSGVGDMDWNGPRGLGFSDYGSGHSTQFDIDPRAPGVLVAVSEDPRDQGKQMTVSCMQEGGTDTTLTVTIKRWAGSSGTFGFDPTAVAGTPVTEVTRVVLPSGLRGYVSLYVCNEDSIHFLAKYHPTILVPEFRRYRVNFARDSKNATSVLAEVRLRFMPLVAPADVIPLDSLSSVQFMMQSVKEFNAGNIQAGAEFQEMASMRLAQKEQAQTRVQGVVVENSLYDLSPGAAMGGFQNI